MKKILAVLFLAMAPMSVFAAGATIISYEGSQKPDDDEFLYENATQYNMAKNGYETTGHKNSGSGYAYECDAYNSGGYTTGQSVTMPVGHVFKGQIINHKASYICKTELVFRGGKGGNDRWEELQDGVCKTNSFGDVPVGQHLMKDGAVRVLTKIECSGIELTDQNGVEFEGVCREGPKFVCKATKCIEGMVVNNGKCSVAGIASSDTSNGGAGTSQSDCVAAAARGEPANWNGTACNCGDKHVWDAVNKKCVAKGVVQSGALQKCLNSRSSAEGKACCYMPSSVATWNGTNCTCVDATKTFNASSRSCVGAMGSKNNNNQFVYTCAESDLNMLYAWLEQYATNAEIQNKINAILEFCTNDSNRDSIKFNSLMAQLRALISAQNQQAQNAAVVQLSVQQTTARNKISGIISKLDSMQDDFKVTVWKDAEGNFNTARLASDSIAAVVLGTTGGLVTSHVVKKNQVEKGFDALQCTVGGQAVAGWGDEFRVGIQ